MVKNLITPLLSMDRRVLYQVLLLGGYLFFVTVGATTGFAAIDTLFLSNYDLSKLPWMYIYVAIASVITGFIFQKISQKLKTHILNVLILIVGSSFSVLSGILVQLEYSFAYPMAYIGIEAIFILAIMSFYNFTANIFDSSQAKKYLGPVGVGASAGGIVGGLIVQVVSVNFGVVYLLYIFSAFLFSSLFFIYPIMKVTGDDYNDGSNINPKKKPKRKKDGEGLFKQIPHLKHLFILTVALSITIVFIDYQFKIALAMTLSEEGIGAFLGIFYIVTGVLNILVQAFATSRILSTFGIVISYLLLPFLLIFTNIGLFLMPILFFAVASEGTVQVVRNTIFNTVNELMYFPIPPKLRARAKSFLDGMVKEGSKGLSGVLLIILASVIPFEYFSIITIALLIVCIVAITQIRKGYLKLLVSNLTNNELIVDDINLENIDQSTIHILEKSLLSQSEHEVLYAYRMLNKIPSYNIEPKLEALIENTSNLIKMEVLSDLEGKKLKSVLHIVKESLKNEEEHVKAQAIKTYASYGEVSDLEVLQAYLFHNRPKIKAAAIYGLIKYHGFNGMFVAMESFRELLGSADPKERSEAAEMIGNLGLKPISNLLIPLLNDTNLEVKKNALESAGKIKEENLIPDIIHGLISNETRRLSTNTLASLDVDIVLPYLERVFSSEVKEAKQVSLYIPEVISKLNDKQGVSLLLNQYKKADSKLKMNIANALASYEGRYVESERLLNIIQCEIAEEERFTNLLHFMPEEERAKLLQEALEEERGNIIYRIFKLSAVNYDAKTVEAVYFNLIEGDKRAKRSAIEVLDNLLREPLRSKVIKFIGSLDNRAIKESEELYRFNDEIIVLYKEGHSWLKMTIANMLLNSEIPIENDKVNIIENRQDWKETIHRVRLLRNVPYFKDVPGSKLAEMSDELKEVKVQKDTFITQEGQNNNSLYIVLSGEVLVSKQGQDIGIESSGYFFNELSLIDRENCIETVKSVIPVTLLELKYGSFYLSILNDLDIAWKVISVINNKLRQALEHVKEIGQKEIMDDNDSLHAITEDLLHGEEKIDKSMIDRILILFKVDLFKNLNQKDLLVLANMLEEEDYIPGQSIVEYGESGNSFYAIVSGKVKVHKNETDLAVLQAGDYFGEMALIDGGPRTASVTAIEACTCVRIDRDEFIAFCNQRKDVIENMLNIMTQRIRKTYLMMS